MAAYIIRRLIQGLGLLIMVTLLVFFIMRLLPGDPLLIYMSNTELQSTSPELYEQLRHEFGLDKPIMVQYANWVADIFHGDLGTSIFYRDKVGKLMLERFPVTLHLGLLSLITGAVLGISAGILAAVRRGRWVDKLVTPLSYIGITIPVFWLGILMIYFFGLKLHWLPVCGYTSPLNDFWLSTRQIIMPVI
jgi:peptide/nickel transport system permease protein